MPRSTQQAEVSLGPQGRLVIPARLRHSLGYEPGDRLLVRATGQSLVIEKASAIRKRIKDRYAKLKGVSLAEELLAERRRDADREAGQ